MSDNKMNAFSVAALSFILIAIVLGVGVDVISNTQDGFSYSVNRVVAVSGSTSYWLNATSAIQLANSNLTSGTVVVTNITGNVILSSGNYTVNYPTGSVIAALLGNHTVNVSYSYDVYNTASVDVMKNGTAATGELASWLPTLGLVVAAGLLISLVAVSFKP